MSGGRRCDLKYRYWTLRAAKVHAGGERFDQRAGPYGWAEHGVGFVFDSGLRRLGNACDTGMRDGEVYDLEETLARTDLSMIFRQMRWVSSIVLSPVEVGERAILYTIESMSPLLAGVVVIVLRVGRSQVPTSKRTVQGSPSYTMDKVRVPIWI